MVIRFPVIDAKEFDASYTRLAERVGCNSSSNVLDCLRTVPADTLHDLLEKTRSDLVSLTSTELPHHVVQDGDFYYTRPSEALKAGNIARIPTIIGIVFFVHPCFSHRIDIESLIFFIGSVLDEGASFGLNYLTSENELRKDLIGIQSPRDFWLLFIICSPLENWIFDKSKSLSETLDALLRHYPDIPSLGSPYPSPARPPGSWDDNSRLFEPLESNQFKRASSIFGDHIFESGRRTQLDDAARAGVPVWNYRFMQSPGDRPPYVGVYHSSEIQYGEECFLYRGHRVVLPSAADWPMSDSFCL